jgi:hypothetical protein
MCDPVATSSCLRLVGEGGIMSREVRYIAGRRLVVVLYERWRST